jgi:hypothetical protein
MKSRDVADLYAQVPLGAIVEIVQDKLPKIPKGPRAKLLPAGAPKPESEVANWIDRSARTSRNTDSRKL